MKVSKYFVIACTALMVSACADEVKDIIAPETPKEEGSKKESSEVAEMIPVTVTVGESSSRISHTDNGNTITVAWEANDVIYLGNPEGITTETFINAENSGFSTLTIDGNSISSDKKTASFTGKIPSSLIGKTLLAFYGSTEKLKVSNSQVIMDFTQQTQSENGLAHLKGYDLMSATVENYDGSSQINLQFKHEGAILKVSFSGLPADGTVSKVVLNLPDGSNDFVTSKTFGTNGVATNGATTNSFELNVSSNYDAVFTLCPITFSSDMNVTVPVTKASGIYSYESAALATNGVTLAAGTYNKVNGGALTVNNELEGAGTEASPYIIDNVDKFNEIADATDAYYTITQDMNFTGVTFTPISTFSGTLDGNGKTISNLTFSVGDGNGGIFAVNNGTIKNLNITDATVTKNGSLDNNGGTGILVGVNNNKISNCVINSSSLNASLTAIGTDIGIGLLVGTNNTGKTISECTVNASDLSISGSKKCYAGGLVGYNFTGNIEFSFVKSATNIDYTATVAGGNIGGLIGRNKGGTIKGCSTNIDINTIDCNFGLKIAGFIGDAFYAGATTIEGCYTTGTLTFKPDTHTYGGFAGSLGGAGKKTLTNCYTSLNFVGGTDHAFVSAGTTDTYQNVTTASNIRYIKGTQADTKNDNINSDNENIKSATAEELKNMVGTFNNLGWDNYEFAIGPNNDEPLIIQKKQ